MGDAEARASVIIAAKGDIADDIKAMTQAIRENTDALKEGRKESEDTEEQTTSLKMVWTEFNSVLEVGKKVLGGIQAAFDQTAGAAVQYASTVRDVARASGTNAEEASKMIQIADDLQVGTDTLKQAFFKLNKEGIQPNLENIKKLATEYQKIKDPVERSQFAFDKFGKSGQEMQKILEADVTELDSMAKAAEKTGLVMSDEAVKAARDYEMAIDDLTDSAEGFKIKIGSQVLPALTEWIKGLNQFQEDQQLANQAMEMGVISSQDLSNIHAYGVGNYLGLSLSAEELTKRINDEIAARKAQVEGLTKWRDETDKAIGFTDALSKSTGDLADETDILKERLNKIHLLLAGPVGKENEQYYEQQKDLGAQIADVTKELDKLQAVQGQTLTVTHAATGTAEELFIAQDKLLSTQYALAKAQQELNDATDPDVHHVAAVKVAELKGAYDKAAQSVKDLGGSTETFVADNSVKIDELKAKQEELRDAYEQNAAKHEEATRRIVFGMVEQRLAADGYTQAEMDLLTGLGEKWGIFDKDTAAALRSVNDSLKDFNAGNVNDTIVKLANVFGYPTEKTYNIKVNYNGPEAGEAGIGTTSTNVTPGNEVQIGGKQAKGGEYVVNRPTMFIAGDAGPEEAKFTPLGMKGNEGKGDTYNFNNYNQVRDDADLEILARKTAGMVAEIIKQG